MRLRFAVPEDGERLVKIYAQYLDTPVTFECVCPTAEVFSARIRDISAQYPYLVCEREGEPVGYAYAHRQMEREAYGWNAELSVYLDRDAVSAGLGKRLYGALIELLRMQGVHNVYGGVTLPNEKSKRLHEGMGFRRLGVYRHTGYKCGAWHDVAWFEREILPCSGETAPFTPIGQIPLAKIEEVLRRYSD